MRPQPRCGPLAVSQPALIPTEDSCMPRPRLLTVLLCLVSWSLAPVLYAAEPAVVRSAASGLWSAPATWDGGKLPSAGMKVQIREGHTVTYDVQSDQVIRSLHIAGTLT